MEELQPIREPHNSEAPTFLKRGRSAKSRAPRLGSANRELLRRNHLLQEQLHDLRREHDDLRRTLFEAAQVQRKLCGPRQLSRGTFEISAEIFPVRDLSGDFVSVFDLGGELVLAIGDISGKGLPSAMWFTHFLGMIQLYALGHEDPSAILESLNRDFCASQWTPPLTTLFLARLELKTGVLTYCNGGHPPALVLRENEEIELLAEGGPLLGAIPGAVFMDGRTTLDPGATLLGYSDGITETSNAAGHEFGVERLFSALRSASPSSATAALFSVLATVEDFAGERPREDDFGLLALRRQPDLRRSQAEGVCA